MNQKMRSIKAAIQKDRSYTNSKMTPEELEEQGFGLHSNIL